MPRIRAIKPGFFKNEALAEFSFAHRLLFAGLWTQADREGRIEDRPRRIKAELFPYDDVDVSAMLDDLAKGRDSLIVRYSVDGVGYLWVRKFADHQRPHHTEPPSTYPSADQADAPAPTLSGAEPLPNRVAPLGREGKGKGNGVEEGKGESQALVVRAPDARPVSPADLAEAWNTERGHLPRCLELTDVRKRKAQQRIRERPRLDDWREIIRRVAGSRFCNGENDRQWRASFDWILQPDVGAKVLEGKYDNLPRLRASGSRTGDSTDAAAAYLRREIGEQFEEGEVIDVDSSSRSEG